MQQNTETNVGRFRINKKVKLKNAYTCLLDVKNDLHFWIILLGI